MAEHQATWDQFVQPLSYDTIELYVVSLLAGSCRVGAVIVDTDQNVHSTGSLLNSWVVVAKYPLSLNTYQANIGKRSNRLQAILCKVGLRQLEVPTGPIRICRSPTCKPYDSRSSRQELQLKLQPKTIGAFQIIWTTYDTVTIDKDGIHDKVPTDRVTRTPDEIDATIDTHRDIVFWLERCQRYLFPS